MAYLTLVGHVPQNQTGVGSRGYHVFRRGRTVVTMWGAIEVRRNPGATFHWAYTPRRKSYRRGSEAAAIDLLKRIVAEQLAQGYTRLPPGSHIK